MQEQKLNAEITLIIEIGSNTIAVEQNISKYPFPAEQHSQILN
jgi:hypothetical protein